MNSLGGAVTAPWNDDEVASLNAYQDSGVFHEYTCGTDDCHPGILIATRYGWFCPDCDYRQFWAHRMTADWSWQLRTVRLHPVDEAEDVW